MYIKLNQVYYAILCFLKNKCCLVILYQITLYVLMKKYYLTSYYIIFVLKKYNGL